MDNIQGQFMAGNRILKLRQMSDVINGEMTIFPIFGIVRALNWRRYPSGPCVTQNHVAMNRDVSRF